MCTVIPLSLSEIAAVTDGRLHGARGTEVVTAVEFDSRAIRPGGLFLALPGERVDGHDFAARRRRARARSACSPRARSTRPRWSCPPVAARHGHLPRRRPTPTARAPRCSPRSRALAAARGRASCPGSTVVGVTGSSGKTSTKDLLAAVLAPLGPTVAPPGVVQQRARPALDGPARRRRHPPPRAGVLRPRHGPHRRAGRRGAAADRRGAQRRLRAPRRVRLRRGDRAGQGRAGRGAAAERGRGAQRRRPARRRDGAAHHRPRASRSAARRRRARRGRHPRRGPRPVPPGHARGERAGGAAAGRRPPRRQRAGRGRGGAASWAAPRRPSRRRSRPPRPRPGGGWRSPTAPTASRWSTTPTTPTRTRWRAALRALAAMGGGRRTWAVLGPMRELGAETRDRPRRASRRWRRSWASTQLVTVDSPEYGAGRPVADVAAGHSRCCAAELAPGDVVLVKASRAAGLRPGRRRAAWSGRRSEGHLHRRGRRAGDLHPAHAVPHPVLRPAGLRPGDPRGRPAEPPGQARHAHDGRRRDHDRDLAGLPASRTWSPASRSARRRCWCCS